MKKYCLAILLVLVLRNAFAQTVITSAELIVKERFYDGQNIFFEGEVIGDIMNRGSFSWINVNDGNNAVGIWINTDLVKDIRFTGSFKNTGDKVRIKGVFNRNCPQHGGDLDIHAEELSIICIGHKNQQNIDTEKVKVVKRLTITLIIVVIVWIFKILRRR